MNKQLLKSLALTVVVMGVGLAVGMFCTTAPQMDGISGMAKGPVLELPEKAARVVAQAVDKQAKAIEVIRAVTGLAQPDMMPPVVSAICKIAPEASGAVVAAAVAAQPGNVVAIAKAAMAASPESVSEIVAAVCQQMPQAHSFIALVAVQQIPSGGDKILSAISDSMPGLAPHIAKAKTYSGDLSVNAILKRADALARDQIMEEAKVAKLNSIQQPIQDLSVPREIAIEPFAAANGVAAGVNRRARTQLSFMDQPSHIAYGEMVMPRFGAPFAAPGANIKEISINDLPVIDPALNYSRP